ncbi:histone deacetylase 11 isoform X3 [Meles meles]|uniref:histone deacetylase 11 isoform X3 n=1 Tax=Meles meles TaxID=9662 RepID=UPI001E69B71B|nr:histone deacetylase 11 isoform X3 [Meles meles]
MNPDLLFLGTVTPTPSSQGVGRFLCSAVWMHYLATAPYFTVKETEIQGPTAVLRDCYNVEVRCGALAARPHATQLYQHVPESRWPIVYSPRYNITFMGLEKLHPFDAGKWGKVISFLKEEKLLSDGMLVEAREASDEDLLVVHTRRYLNALKAGKLAMERGWAINVGGGFHHCSSDRGGGFCAYADITLAIKFLFERVEGVSRATIVDLDAHQGNGHERDFMGDKRVYIMDVYNRHIYPGDRFAKQAIRRKVELEWGTEDDEYLDKVERNLQKALQEHLPDVVVYNAGTDILEGDRLGGLSISPQGIVKRDELVFRVVRGRQVPILMVTSGGYQKRTARIIADSILNLYSLGLIGAESPSVSAQNSDTPLLPPEEGYEEPWAPM